MKRPYHQTPSASQGNAFTAHIDGRTQIQWSTGQHNAAIAKKASERNAEQLTERILTDRWGSQFLKPGPQ